MNKNNEYRKMQENIKMPEGLKEKTMLAARQLEENDKNNKNNENIVSINKARKPKHSKLKRFAAAAAAFVCVVAAGNGILNHNTLNTNEVGNNNNSFGIVAYAAETGEITEPKNSRIIFSSGDGEGGADWGFFSGSLFKVTGENIKSVSMKVNKGGIYRQREYYYTEEQMNDMLKDSPNGNIVIDGSDTVMLSSDSDMKNWTADACWVLGKDAEADYNADDLFGFWIDGATYEQLQNDEDDDLRVSWHKTTDYFDGAELEITVSFDDGSEKTEKLSLKTGKLEVDYDDNGNMFYTGNVLEDNDNVTPYDYGVYAEIGNMQ